MTSEDSVTQFYDETCLAYSYLNDANRGNREFLDRRLCRPYFEQWPRTRNDYSKIIRAQLLTKCIYFKIFFVSSIFSYRPRDLSLLKEFSKNVSF